MSTSIRPGDTVTVTRHKGRATDRTPFTGTVTATATGTLLTVTDEDGLAVVIARSGELLTDRTVAKVA